MTYGPLIIMTILVLCVAAVALGWHEVSLVRGRRLASRFDRTYEANLAARGRRPRT